MHTYQPSRAYFFEPILFSLIHYIFQNHWKFDVSSLEALMFPRSTEKSPLHTAKCMSSTISTLKHLIFWLLALPLMCSFPTLEVRKTFCHQQYTKQMNKALMCHRWVPTCSCDPDTQPMLLPHTKILVLYHHDYIISKIWAGLHESERAMCQTLL